MTTPRRSRPQQIAEWTCPKCDQRFVNKNQVHSCNRQTIDAFFDGDEANQRLFDMVHQFLATLGPIDVAATKTQISFRARIRFAYVWFPNRVRGTGKPEMFLTFDLRRPEPSTRIRERVNPRSDLWVHHFLLRERTDFDQEVKDWLREAFDSATATPARRKRGV